MVGEYWVIEKWSVKEALQNRKNRNSLALREPSKDWFKLITGQVVICSLVTPLPFYRLT